MNEDQTNELLAKVKAEANSVLNEKNFADAATVEGLKATIEGASTSKEVKEISNKMDLIAQDFEAMKESNKASASKGLIEYVKENSDTLKAIKNGSRTANFDVTVKATEVASDIGSRDVYATLLPGTGVKPVRATRVLDLFKRKAVSTEYIKYREEDVVTRDAKFVVACATSTHLTKKSYVIRTVELAKIRDIMDACIDMLDDYAWVESELKALVNESIKLKAEFELLLGSGSNATDMLSINTISSEFNPANALGNFSTASGTPFQDANLEQLVDAMGAQISIFGQENSWMATTVVMNFRDFVNYRNLKDSDGNKLVHTLSDSMPTIAGMNVVTSPIVSANTLFVFDASQGEILDRQSITLKTSFENNDNIEHETVTFVGVERLQFHVPIIKRDAFMKCSDVATAITAITKA